MSQGEFTFTMTERKDRNGKTYLFGGLKMLNSVLFIRKEEGLVAPGQRPKWKAVLKPYEPKNQDPDAATWNNEEDEHE